MRRNNRLLFIFLYFFSILFAQDQELFLLDFLKAVRDFHPLSLRAGFEKEMAYARFLSAHQLIEPRIEADVKSKGFEEKNYYDKTKVGVVLPIWYGLELEAGWMENTGAKLGNEESLGQSSYVGGVWRLGKFFSDSARYEFQQAKLGKKYAIENQKIQLNNLFFEAAKAFYQWQKIFYQKKIIDNLLIQNRERLSFVKKSVKFGDKAAIDTLDVLTQIQTFEIERLALEQSYQAAIFQMNRFLFDQDQNNYTLNSQFSPALQTSPLLEDLSFYLGFLANHPKILQNQYKITSYEIDRNFRIQQFFPQVEVYYHILSRDFFSFASKNLNNFSQYGLKLKLPLLFLGSSGKFRMNQYKIKAQAAENTAFAIELENKIKTYYHQVLFLQAQLAGQQKNVSMSQTLYEVEQKRWKIGESSVFLLNLREVKYLESQIKYIDLQAKLQESYTQLQEIIVVL